MSVAYRLKSLEKTTIILMYIKQNVSWFNLVGNFFGNESSQYFISPYYVTDKYRSIAYHKKSHMQ